MKIAYYLKFEDGTEFSSEHVLRDSMWNIIPNNKSIVELYYNFADRYLFKMEGYEAYNHIIEYSKILNVKGEKNGICKVSVMGRYKIPEQEYHESINNYYEKLKEYEQIKATRLAKKIADIIIRDKNEDNEEYKENENDDILQEPIYPEEYKIRKITLDFTTKKFTQETLEDKKEWNGKETKGWRKGIKTEKPKVYFTDLTKKSDPIVEDKKGEQ